MRENDSFWDLYWDVRLQQIENLGKREAILAVSRLIRRICAHGERSLRLLELGCGEGQIIGNLVEGHAHVPGIRESMGVDHLAASIAACRRMYPAMRFVDGDFTAPDLLAGLGKFEIVLLVNALHEVFSAGYSEELGQVDVPTAKFRALEALSGAAGCLAPGGYLALFDGLEPPGDPLAPVRIRFLNEQARAGFDVFAREYHPFRIAFRSPGPLRVELSRRDFTRYITKSIFLGKRLWQTERFESYQYFNEQEFRAAFARLGLTIEELRTLTVDEDKWRQVVEIETPGESFPEEHILITGRKANLPGD